MLYTFAFYSFICISNILPLASISFDVSRHLCRGDIFFSEMGATVLLKCSKTLQDRNKIRIIVIWALGETAICLVAAMKRILATHQLGPSDQLFTINHVGRTIALTNSTVRKHLQLIGTKLQHPVHLTFHMFKKGGTSWAPQHGAPLQDIMLHGTWSSNAVWR